MPEPCTGPSSGPSALDPGSVQTKWLHSLFLFQLQTQCIYVNIGCFLLQCILTTTVSTEYLIQIGPSSRSSRCASRCGPVPRSLVSMVLVLLAIECTNAYGLLCASLPSFQICRSTPSQATLALIYEIYCIPWCIWNHWCIWLTYPLCDCLPTVSENISDINDIQY